MKLSVYEEAHGMREPFLLSLLKKDSDSNWYKAVCLKCWLAYKIQHNFKGYHTSSSQIGDISEGLLKNILK